MFPTILAILLSVSPVQVVEVVFPDAEGLVVVGDVVADGSCGTDDECESVYGSCD